MSIKKTVSDDEIWGYFRDILRENAAIVRFEKVNGEIRTMKCTLQPEAYDNYEFKGGENPDEDVLPVWDLEKDAWRSIRKGTLIEVTVLDK
jgi:hypothetical protein